MKDPNVSGASNNALNKNVNKAYGTALDTAGSMVNSGAGGLTNADRYGRMAGDAFKTMADTPTTTLADADRSKYMNPFTQDVIDATMGEMNRQEAIQQQGVDDRATAQNAFGGDRQQIQKAAMNRDFDVTRKNAIAELYNANFNKATEGAQFDINTANAMRDTGAKGLGELGSTYGANAGGLLNSGMGQLGSLANLGFGWGENLEQRQLAMGGMQQSQQQAIMDAIRRQFQGYTGTPDTNIGRLQGNTMSPGGAGTTTTQNNPGIAGTIASLLAML